MKINESIDETNGPTVAIMVSLERELYIHFEEHAELFTVVGEGQVLRDGSVVGAVLQDDDDNLHVVDISASCVVRFETGASGMLEPSI